MPKVEPNLLEELKLLAEPVELLPPSEAADWLEHPGTQTLLKAISELAKAMRASAFSSVVDAKEISQYAMKLLYLADAVTEVRDLIHRLGKGAVKSDD